MTNVFEYFVAANKAGVDTAAQLARLSFANTEALAKLSFDFSRTQFDEMVKQAPSASELRDPASLVATRTKVAEAAMAKTAQFGREAYGIAVGHQAEVRKLVEGRVSDIQKDVAAFAEEATKAAPVGNDFTANAFKNAFTASTVFTDSIMRAGKQASSFVDAAFKAQETAVETAQATVKSASKRK